MQRIDGNSISVNRLNFNFLLVNLFGSFAVFYIF